MRSAENPHAGQGAVLLDVGGDIGALVLTMPASMEGIEIEIRPQQTSLDSPPHYHTHPHDHEDHSHLTHVEVVPRPTSGGYVPCAVFGELTHGRYELYERPNGPVMLVVTITGGEIAQASWPT